MTVFTTPTLVRRPPRVRQIAERVRDDFGAFAFDGWGIMLSDDQLEARARIGPFGPRRKADPKYIYVSGGQRGGKTVFLALEHADGGLYKRGVDNTDRVFWRNYLYKTLAIAPTTDLTLKLWTVMDEITKGASDAQWDRRARRSRGGAFLGMMRAGKLEKWPVVHYEWGGRTDFRSSEGWAYRLEGDQWWGITWDEWASQPDREIEFVLSDVLLGRSRDHDAKIVPAAWPKAVTERHLIAVIREIESGSAKGREKRVVYIRSDRAHFTNLAALQTEKLTKSAAQWKRTVLGEPAGGASVEFPADVVTNMVDEGLAWPVMPEGGNEFRYFVSWDLGLAHDATVGLVWRIPRVGVTPRTKARIVNAVALHGRDGLTLDAITYSIAREQAVYGAESAIDASAMGGIATVRQLRDLKPPPLSFVVRAHDRIHGNMRLAAIANGLELLTWERTEDEAAPWGVVECPPITELTDQLANFDRDAKNVPDDWVWSFLIGLWYIRKYWLSIERVHRPAVFDRRIIRSQRRFWR